ncbi:MAG: hypothetical protein HGB33_08515 [Syntrophaceae bacterium]|nr:hypothetical protein [Syntrophaceae bacterium]
MKGLRLLTLTVLLLVSCRTLPAINPVSQQPESKASVCPVCPSPFLKEPYRLVHVIEARVAGETQGAIIGVTLINPSSRFVSCAIMTAEGMVLFEAEAAPLLKLIRALPPFDSRDFTRNMMEDIKLIFLAPEGKITTKGILSDGAEICRWQTKSAEFVDVIARPQETFEINRYTASGEWKRRVKLKHSKENLYQNIELTAKDAFDYSLVMTLIESEPAESELQTKNQGLPDNEKNCGR